MMSLELKSQTKDNQLSRSIQVTTETDTNSCRAVKLGKGLV